MESALQRSTSLIRPILGRPSGGRSAPAVEGLEQLVDDHEGGGGGRELLSRVREAQRDPVHASTASGELGGLPLAHHQLAKEPEQPLHGRFGSPRGLLVLLGERSKDGERERRPKAAGVDRFDHAGAEWDRPVGVGAAAIDPSGEQRVANRPEGHQPIRRVARPAVGEPAFGQGEPVEGGDDVGRRGAFRPCRRMGRRGDLVRHDLGCRGAEGGGPTGEVDRIGSGRVGLDLARPSSNGIRHPASGGGQESEIDEFGIQSFTGLEIDREDRIGIRPGQGPGRERRVGGGGIQGFVAIRDRIEGPEPRPGNRIRRRRLRTRRRPPAIDPRLESGSKVLEQVSVDRGALEHGPGPSSDRRRAGGLVLPEPDRLEDLELDRVEPTELRKVLRGKTGLVDESKQGGGGRARGAGRQLASGQGEMSPTVSTQRHAIDPGTDPGGRRRQRARHEWSHRTRDLDLERQSPAGLVPEGRRQVSNDSIAESLGERTPGGSPDVHVVTFGGEPTTDGPAVEPQQDTDRGGVGDLDGGSLGAQLRERPIVEPAANLEERRDAFGGIRRASRGGGGLGHDREKHEQGREQAAANAAADRRARPRIRRDSTPRAGVDRAEGGGRSAESVCAAIRAVFSRGAMNGHLRGRDSGAR